MTFPVSKEFSQEPGGGLNYVLNAFNNNLINASKAKYADWNNYANAASRIAYSQFVGPQAIASFINDAKTRGLLTDDQYKSLADSFSQQVQGQGNALGSLPNPNQGGGGNPFGTFINWLMNRGNPQGQMGMQQPQSGGMQQMSPSPNQLPIPPNGEFGSQNRMSDQEVQNLVDNKMRQLGQREASPDINSLNKMPKPQAPIVATPPRGSLTGSVSPAAQRAGVSIPEGRMGGENPEAARIAQEKALESGSSTEAINISNQWKDRQDKIKDSITNGQEMERQVDKLNNAYSRLHKWEKGPVFGAGPDWSTAAKDFGLAQSNLVASRLSAWQSNHITDKDIGFGQMLKQERTMNPESIAAESNYQKGLAHRMTEYAAFARRAQKLNLTPAESDIIWARYANEKPFYDPDSKKMLKKNLDSWEDYLDKDSIDETFSPRLKKARDEWRKNMHGGDKKKDEKIVNQGKKLIDKSKALELVLFPKFNSPEEVRKWFKQQDKPVQQAFAKYLKEDGNK